MAFGRVCELWVGSFPNGNRLLDNTVVGDGLSQNLTETYAVTEGSGYLIRDLHFTFDILRTVDFFKNYATFKIYNANDETITKVMSEGRAVVFRAGHKNQKVGNIFVGQIDECYTETLNNGDTVTNLICVSQRGPEYPLGRVMMTVSVPKGATYYDVLKAIADFAGVPLSGASILKDFVLDGRYYDIGSISDLVYNFKTNYLLELGGDVIIDNNEMLYIQKVGGDKDEGGVTSFETLALTLATGLLSAKKVRKERTSVESKFRENISYYMGVTDRPKEETPEEKRKRVEKERQEPAKPKAQVSFTCLLTPELSPNLPVYVDNRRIRSGAIDETDKRGFAGVFNVVEVRFRGDNHGGQFIAECKGEQRGT